MILRPYYLQSLPYSNLPTVQRNPTIRVSTPVIVSSGYLCPITRLTPLRLIQGKRIPQSGIYCLLSKDTQIDPFQAFQGFILRLLRNLRCSPVGYPKYGHSGLDSPILFDVFSKICNQSHPDTNGSSNERFLLQL